MTQRKIFNFDSNILIKETIEKYSYSPENLGKTSTKFIVAICRFCGKKIDVRMGNFNKIGSACHKICRLEQQKLQFSPFNDPNVRKKSEQTKLLRFGTINVSQNEEIRKKISFAKRKRDIINKKPSDNKINFIESMQSITTNIVIDQKITKSGFKIDCFFKDMRFGIIFNNSLESSEKILDFKTCQKRQRDKLDLCRNKNIRLMHIFEHKWIDRKDQYINFIKTILGENAEQVMARKCDIDYRKQKDFINENHIQGYGLGTIVFFNLIYNNKILASITLSGHHRQNSDKNSVILNRLCFKDGYNVPGGASKLFKYCKNWAIDRGYDRILSWSDNCWTEGNIYKILGFNLETEYGPDYFYYDTNTDSYRSKQSQKKSTTNCPDGMTEREWCIERGLYRIWDCGKKKWVIDLV